MRFASIVILSYKRREFLERTLNSLHAHTQFPYELIIVDDGSDDISAKYIFELINSQKISSVILNAGPNMGIGTGINRGFSISKGEFLIKCDSDIEFQDGWLNQGVACLDEFPQLGMVGFFKYHHDPCKHADKYLCTLSSERVAVDICSDFVSSIFMIRTNEYRAYGPLPEHNPAFDEDVVFKKRLQNNHFLLGLTASDCVTNFGFGIPHSTVVNPDMSVTKVHQSPLIFGLP